MNTKGRVRGLNKYYATFGYDQGGGWVEITCESYTKACDLMYAVYGPHYCSVYPEKVFQSESMYKDGNLGKRCVARITFERVEG